MWMLAAHTFAVAGAVMLVVSGSQHVADHRPLLASMLAHRVVRYPAARALSRTVPAAQLLAGAAGLVVLATPLRDGGFGRSVMVFCCVLYVALSAYLAAVLHSGEAADCACFGRSEAVTWFSLVRTVLPTIALAWVSVRPTDASSTGVALAVLLGVCAAGLAISWSRIRIVSRSSGRTSP